MKVIDHYSPRGCANGMCPGIIVTDRNTVLVQGRVLLKYGRAQLTVPGHADAVVIPPERAADRLFTAETGCRA
jgi:hypothetical protein